MAYLKNLFIALDQLANSIFGGYADETLSARCWRENRTISIKVIDMIFFFDKDHCLEAYKSEKLRKQLPIEYN